MDEIKLGHQMAKGARARDLLTQLEPYFEEMDSILAETFRQAITDEHTISIKNVQRGLDTFRALLETLVVTGELAQKDRDRLSGRVTTLN